jgi:hypothetical protein
METPEEGYDGPARVRAGDREIAVRATLSGHFEPISGQYQWAGRVRHDEPVDVEASADVLRPGAAVEVRTAEGHHAGATVRETDPWGGVRVRGTGRPPFAVPSETP